MTVTIAYDKPVKNLIDELSATGHVTHTAYRKTSVTLHHNGGRLSHEGVLNVWKTRLASAHFDVDSSGAVAQFVKVNEYAWAVGDRAGNQSTISIEMANATLSPGWTVADATWKGAARLAGWLFFKVIGQRPSKSNLFYHKHWSSTDCAGPYMDKIYDKVLSEAQRAYDSFDGVKPSSPSSPSPSTPGKKPLVDVAKDVIAGKYGNEPQRSAKLRSEGYNPAAVQNEVNHLLSGTPAPAKSVRQIAGEVIDGKWGNGDSRLRALRGAGYNPAEIQAEVNRLLKGTNNAPDRPNRLTNAQLAEQVIAGKWGNDPQRSAKLRAAGYNPEAVQSEVNRRV